MTDSFPERGVGCGLTDTERCKSFRRGMAITLHPDVRAN